MNEHVQEPEPTLTVEARPDGVDQGPGSGSGVWLGGSSSPCWPWPSWPAG